MQKTTLGISVALLGALTYFVGFFGGLSALILIAGYVLIKEENEWLRNAAVKAVVLSVVYYVAIYVIGLIPDAIDLVEQTVQLVISDFYISLSFVSKIVNWITNVLGYIRTLAFLGLGLKALNQGTIAIPVVDDIVNKYTKA